VSAPEGPDDFLHVKDLLEQLAIGAFGSRPGTARAEGACVRCERPALEHCSTEAGRREYAISALCEECFDAMFSDDD